MVGGNQGKLDPPVPGKSNMTNCRCGSRSARGRHMSRCPPIPINSRRGAPWPTIRTRTRPTPIVTYVFGASGLFSTGFSGSQQLLVEFSNRRLGHLIEELDPVWQLPAREAARSEVF